MAVGTDAITAIAERLIAEADPLARRMVERYREEIADYRLADETFLREQVQSVTYANVVAVARSMLGDDSARDEAVAQTREGAARRVRQGISLASFLHAARLLGQELWEWVLSGTDPSVAAEREAALELAAIVMRHVDLASSAAAEGYVNEVQTIWNDREVVRRDLLEDLLSGQGDSERVRGLARSLKLELADRYVVIVARGDAGVTHDTPDQPLAARVALRRIVEAARAHLRPAVATLLVGMRQGEVVALYPVDDELEPLKTQATALAAALGDQQVAIGVGGNYPGVRCVADSYAEAKEAIDIAHATGVRGRPVIFDEVLIDHVIRSSPHRDRILDATLRPLISYDERRQAELVSTLRAYVQTGFNLTRAAEVLNVHPNTVVYRLRRIRELSGRDPQDADDLLLLFLGLKLHAHHDRH